MVCLDARPHWPLEAQTPGTDMTALVVVAAILGSISLIALVFARRARRGSPRLAGGLRVAEGAFRWDADLDGAWWGRVGDARFGIDRLLESVSRRAPATACTTSSSTVPRGCNRSSGSDIRARPRSIPAPMHAKAARIGLDAWPLSAGSA